MPRKMDYERAKRDKKDSAQTFTVVSITRFGNPHGMQLQPWKPEKARTSSKGGQWLCEVCCKNQHGSKHDHKNVCLGFIPYRRKQT